MADEDEQQTHGVMTGSVEMIVLPALESSVKAAREWIAKIATEVWQIDDYIPRLAISELCTNAIRHSTPDQQIIARAYERAGKRIAEIWDQSPALPVPRHAAPTDENGRGLALLTHLVAHWGTRPLSPAETGKIVYVEFH